MPPVISVIIPTYKPDKYLYECLDSLFRQTLSHNFFEIIIVLNGDKKPYINDLIDYTKDVKNISVLHTNESGVSNARNIGIEYSKGLYICFIDDDDIISDNYLENLFDNIHGKDKIISVSNVYCFNKDINSLEYDYLTYAFYRNTKNNLYERRKFLSTSCCKIIPREVIGEKRFDKRFKKGEDALFMFAISSEIEVISKASDNTIYYRRIRENSASRKRQNLNFRIVNAKSLIIAYVSIYKSNIKKYDKKLFISRIVATIFNM